MTVAELIEKLQKLDPYLEVRTPYIAGDEVTYEPLETDPRVMSACELEPRSRVCSHSTYVEIGDN